MSRSGSDPRADLRWPPVAYWVRVFIALLAVFALARAVVQVRQIIVLVVIALILAIGLQPAVNGLERRGMKRGLAVALIFFVGLLVVVGFLALVTPTIVRQVQALVREAPDYLRRAQAENSFVADLNSRFDLTGKLQSVGAEAPSTVLALIKSFTAFIFNLVTVLILTLYFTSALPRMERWFAALLRPENRDEFERIIDQSTERVGGYMIGNVIISLIAGVLAFVALAAMGVPYPAALAFWVALADLIPTVGAYLGAAPAVLVAGFDGVPALVGTAIYFLVYQQVENYVVAPRVMTKAVDLSAAAVIVAVLIGGSLAGFAGALLALPAAVIVKVTVQELLISPRLATIRDAEAP